MLKIRGEFFVYMLTYSIVHHKESLHECCCFMLELHFILWIIVIRNTIVRQLGPSLLFFWSILIFCDGPSVVPILRPLIGWRQLTNQNHLPTVSVLCQKKYGVDVMAVLTSPFWLHFCAQLGELFLILKYEIDILFSGV